jgi:hypothetical protein
MITHLVLMRPRAGLSADDRRAFVRAFERAVRDIPTVRRTRIGRRMIHGAGYEASAPSVEYLAAIDFDDLDGLQTYLGHPAHAEIGDLFGRLLASAIVVDFEVGGIEDAERLVR